MAGDSKDDLTLIGGVEKRDIRVVEYDDRWPAQYKEHATIITKALGNSLLQIEHVGSTSVEGLAAKPIIDILVVVADSADESSYLPQLQAAGYELRVREPGFHEHRMLRTPPRDVHVHVYSHGNSEVDRILLFRDRIRRDPEDRKRYESVKRRLTEREWPDMNAYADAKTEVIESILTAAMAEIREP